MRKQLTFTWVHSIEDCLRPNEGKLCLLHQGITGKIGRVAFADFADLWLLNNLRFYLLHSPDDAAAYDLINAIYRSWDHHFDHEAQAATWCSQLDNSMLIELRKNSLPIFELRNCVGTLSPALIPDERTRKTREEDINELLRSTLRLNY